MRACTDRWEKIQATIFKIPSFSAAMNFVWFNLSFICYTQWILIRQPEDLFQCHIWDCNIYIYIYDLIYTYICIGLAIVLEY